MKKVLFVLPSLAAGGAERVISFVAQNLDPAKFEAILLITGSEKNSVYQTGKIKTIFLNKRRLVNAVPSVIKQIRILKPDIVLSSISHVNILMGCLSIFFKKIHFVGREASVLSVMNNFSTINSKAYLQLIKLFYPKLSKIICQSEDMYIDFNKHFNIQNSKLIVINNPITTQIMPVKRPGNNTDIIQFVTVGRLSDEKGHYRILKGLAKISEYDFHYTIIGNGPMKDELFNLAEELGLSSKITHIPFTSTILISLASMDVFLQGSYVEGFPNAALESCIAGTPVIAFNAPGGTKEIIENGVNGFIVETENEFEELLKNKHKFTSLNPDRIREQVVNKFNATKIIGQFEELFNCL